MQIIDLFFFLPSKLVEWGRKKRQTIISLTRIVLCEPRSDSLTVLQEFVRAMHHAGRLFCRQCLGGEVVCTGVETSFHETRVETHEVLHLLLLDDLWRLSE